MSHALPTPPPRKTSARMDHIFRRETIRDRIDSFFLRDLSLKGFAGFLGRLYRFFALIFDIIRCWPWLKVLWGESTRILFWVYPRIIFRYTLPYLAADFGRYQRLEMIKAHYQFINQKIRPDVFATMLVSGVCLHQWVEAGRVLSIVMRGPCLVTRHREGELSLVFQLDGVDLYKLAFSFMPKSVLRDMPQSGETLGAKDCLYVGQIQGQCGQIELLKEAASLCHDVGPQDALMSALAGVARAWSMDTVLGVIGPSNLSLEAISRSRSSFDYDAFWERYHASKVLGNLHWMVKLPYAEKPISEIASKHRRRTLCKRQFKLGLATSVFSAVAGLPTGAGKSGR